MKIKLSTMLILISTQTVSAASCHRYKYWFYKTPQRCYTAEVYKPRLSVKFIPEEPVSVELPGALSYLRFNKNQIFPMIEVPTDIACPYSDERMKALCMIKIEVDKKNGDKTRK